MELFISPCFVGIRQLQVCWSAIRPRLKNPPCNYLFHHFTWRIKETIHCIGLAKKQSLTAREGVEYAFRRRWSPCCSRCTCIWNVGCDRGCDFILIGESYHELTKFSRKWEFQRKPFVFEQYFSTDNALVLSLWFEQLVHTQTGATIRFTHVCKSWMQNSLACRL